MNNITFSILRSRYDSNWVPGHETPYPRRAQQIPSNTLTGYSSGGGGVTTGAVKVPTPSQKKLLATEAFE